MSTRISQARTPGILEIVVGLCGITLVGIGGGLGLVRLGLDQGSLGLLLTALSGVGGMAGFYAAYSVRIRLLSAFGVRKTTWRWILIGALVGALTFVVKSAAILLYMALFNDDRTPQDIYATGARGGVGAAIIATFCLGVLTPIGEELLFRGVITTALLRWGAWVGVLGGALVFAVFHGINMVFPAALVTGIAAGEVFRRSGSIWPAVAVHIVVNVPTIPLMLLAGIG